ncbi:diguanylate cyclase domain-containing protein [Pedomonas mirosovicensis]|uniref:diguanylate cyclase domain-containing protein n=1 Tax=Pedomonas mirosovicensis TaxID=2908641 RepID=UPI002167F5C4|nr:diguanylate cyclase [Pedomonas mirosovicensis]MCH8686031.1 diguanylate cyclase [Pedomonas mirosovicensis]
MTNRKPSTPSALRAQEQPRLRDVLRRVHLRVTLVSAALAGLAVLLAGFVVIRAYALDNLALIGQAASYTAEAATVFNDEIAVAEALAPTIKHEEITEISIILSDGRTLWSWRRAYVGTGHRLRYWVNELIFPDPVVVPITHQGREVAVVHLSGDAGGLLRYVAVALAGALACLVFSAITAMSFSRRLQQTIVEPLQRLTAVAHSVRVNRTFDRRVPSSSIAEITALADDFNALLTELEAWGDKLRRENESLAHLALHDSLTGLPNRARFEVGLRQAVGHARETGGQVALLFMDCNDFKEINDQLGHACGDAVLAEIGARISKLLGDAHLAARLGGDEFAILLAPLASPADAQALADQLLLRMADPIRLPDGTGIKASVSIGMAFFPDPCGDEEALLEVADKAMYEAKRSRRRMPPDRVQA